MVRGGSLSQADPTTQVDPTIFYYYLYDPKNIALKHIDIINKLLIDISSTVITTKDDFLLL